MDHFTHPLALVDTPRRQPRLGDHSCTVTVDGAQIEVGYDLEGSYLPATRDDPAEYPTVSIVSVDFGCGPLFGDHATAWDERLELWDLIEQEERK